METMRYQENKKNSKWPIFAFLSFVIIGGALIYIGISNEDEPEIIGKTRDEVQSLVDIYSKETISKIDDENININDITFKVNDEKYVDSSNSKFKADIILPRITIDESELTGINEEIKNKYTDLFKSIKEEMTSVENKFTFKTSYKYYDNVIGDRRILSITIYQRIIDDGDQTSTTDKVETYNIDLNTKEIVEESTIALSMFGKEYKTIIKNSVKNYVVNNNMIKSEEFVYALTGLENYYIKDGKLHIIFNPKELVDEKYNVLDIEINN